MNAAQVSATTKDFSESQQIANERKEKIKSNCTIYNVIEAMQ